MAIFYEREALYHITSREDPTQKTENCVLWNQFYLVAGFNRGYLFSS